MIQVFGILGFFIGLLAIFFASEVMRRASQQNTKLETALFKVQLQITDIEKKMHHVDRLAADIRHQKKRQAETLSALATSGEKQAQQDAPQDASAAASSRSKTRSENERFTPSDHNVRKSG